MPYVHFDHPYPAVDLLLVTVEAGVPRILLIRRPREPEAGWALPGAYVQLGETIEQTATRVLREKAGLPQAQAQRFVPLRPFSGYIRDPRRETISLPQLRYLMPEMTRFTEDPEAQLPERAWADLSLDPPGRVHLGGGTVKLVFDHHEIVREAIREMQRSVELDDVEPFVDLLPATFTLRDLQVVTEALLGHQVNRDSFRRRVLDAGRLEATGQREQDVGHRPAKLYRWVTSP
jgi:8-oxo-dGTP diphosphatase